MDEIKKWRLIKNITLFCAILYTLFGVIIPIFAFIGLVLFIIYFVFRKRHKAAIEEEQNLERVRKMLQEM